MSQSHPSRTRRLYPIRYWIFVVFAVGLPNFVKFDGTGRTHAQGLFNAASLSAIALTLITAFLMLSVTLLNPSRVRRRTIGLHGSLWVLLLIDLLVASVLQPASRLEPYKQTDLLLSFYRIGEWMLAVLLPISLYIRENIETAQDLMIHLIAIVCWVNVIIVWIALPFLPGLVYTSPEDAASGHSRLGGLMIHPGQLSVLAGVAFFHALFFMKGPKRTAACAFAFVTVVMTYARTEVVVLLLALVIYILVLSRSTLLRWFAVLSGATAVMVAITFQEHILSYLERGQGMRNITTLSERTLVWKASLAAIAQRPYIGYGFIAGARNAIRDHWTATNWVPPHAHNEFIQAALSGGLPAALLVIAIYVSALWVAMRNAARGNKQAFLLIVLIQISMLAFTMPVITSQYSRVSGLFLLAYIAVVSQQRALLGSTAETGHRLQLPERLEAGWVRP
jgi:O-antigen ligase